MSTALLEALNLGNCDSREMQDNLALYLIQQAEIAMADIETNITHINAPWYKSISKARNKYYKYCRRNPECFDVAINEELCQFAIPFTHIPDNIFSLMKNINWIEFDSLEPRIHKNLFYASKYHDDETNRKTISEWYIDWDLYYDLLLIDDSLKHTYTPEVA